MKNKLAKILVTAFLGSALILGSCMGAAAAAEPADGGNAEEAAEAAGEEEEAELTEAEQAIAKLDPATTEILVVSFGTSYPESRTVTIGGIENAIRERVGEIPVCRAFTSQIIIDKLKKRDHIQVDNVGEAIERAKKNGVKTLIVQPTHLMDGFEYTDLAEELTANADSFDNIVLGDPLLTSEEDYAAVAEAITKKTESYIDGQTAVCFMGHGTEADSNEDYAKLQKVLDDAGYADYFIGTVEAEPSVEDLIEAVGKDSKYKRVILEPLMVVAGDHANNDMAGDEDDSWKSQFEKAGYDVECILEGLGQVYEIEEIYVQHVEAAILSLES